MLDKARNSKEKMEKVMSNPNVKKTILFFNIIFFIAFLSFSFTETVSIIPYLGDRFSISFFISLIGIPLFCVSYFFCFQSKLNNKLIMMCLLLFLGLSISSFGMALMLTPSYSGYFDTNPVKVWLEITAKYLYDFICLFYVFCMFKYITINKFIKGLRIYILIMLGFTFFQFIVFFANNAALYKFYDVINFLGLFQKSSLIQRLVNAHQSYRAYGFSGEPGHNCIFVSCIAIPILSTEIAKKIRQSEQQDFLTIVALIGVVVFGLLTRSPAVYIGMLINFLAFFGLFLKSHSIKRILKVILSLFITFAIALVFIIPSIREQTLSYFAKIIDLNNQSTVSHYSSVYNDFIVFTKFPLFGSGDGMQGYFYMDNVIGTFFSRNVEVQSLMSGERGLIEGGAGVPSIVSGFGVYGIVVISIFVYKVYSNHFSFKSQEPLTKLFIVITSIVLLIMLLVRSGIHRNYGILLLFALHAYSCNIQGKKPLTSYYETITI